MDTFRFILEPYKTPSSRYKCPSCGHKKTFTRYIDTQTGLYLADHVGRCNREFNCGYHYTPRQYFSDNGITIANPQTQPFRSNPERIKPASITPDHLLKKTLKQYRKNNLVTFLLSLFDEDIVTGLIEKYQIGTSKHWEGSTIFWQRDLSGNIRGGKVMLYNRIDGHRVKYPHNLITWVHKIMKTDNYNLVQCFFGEHLLAIFPDFPIAIVESEKTALIASIYFPQYVWIATGGLYGCKWTSRETCKALSGRKVVLWPDANAFDIWQKAIPVLQNFGLKVRISDLLEKETTTEEKKAGVDIADYLTGKKHVSINQFNDRHPP